MLVCDVAILGAGGAGMMCAIAASARGKKVVLIDHSEKIGRKILISGGGRCNFTNLNAGPHAFVSANPHFAKSALSRYTQHDFIALVEKHRIKYHEKKLGQLFCDESAQQIVDMLVDECSKAGAQFMLSAKNITVTKDEMFAIRTSEGEVLADSLVVATGGLSIPQIGATGLGYQLARQFGLSIIETAPALDGFNFSPKDLKIFGDLAGVSLDCQLTTGDGSFRENILFTHTGLSGPASLQASLYWHKGQAISIDLMPGVDSQAWLKEAKLKNGKHDLKSVLSEHVPKRFAERFATICGAAGPLAEMSDQLREKVENNLSSWKIHPQDTVGYRKAEVTRGGVDTNELSSKTMESKKVPGLYFIGEVVDVTGWLGGYNFQWAWSSGYAAGSSV